MAKKYGLIKIINNDNQINNIHSYENDTLYELIDSITYKKKNKNYNDKLNLLSNFKELINSNKKPWIDTLNKINAKSIAIKYVTQDDHILKFNGFVININQPHQLIKSITQFNNIDMKDIYYKRGLIFDKNSIKLKEKLTPENYLAYLKEYTKKKKQITDQTIDNYLNNSIQIFTNHLNENGNIYVQDENANIKITRIDLIKDIKNTLDYKIITNDIVETKSGDFVYESLNDKNIIYTNTFIKNKNIQYK